MAQRNYGFFCMFLFCVMVYIAVVMFGVITASAKDIDELQGTIRIVVIASIVIFFVGMTLAVGTLCGFHVFLCCTGRTTKETLGRRHDTPAGDVEDEPMEAIGSDNSPPDIFSQFYDPKWVKGSNGKVINNRTYLCNRPESLLRSTEMVVEEIIE